MLPINLISFVVVLLQSGCHLAKNSDIERQLFMLKLTMTIRFVCGNARNRKHFKSIVLSLHLSADGCDARTKEERHCCGFDEFDRFCWPLPLICFADDFRNQFAKQ